MHDILSPELLNDGLDSTIFIIPSIYQIFKITIIAFYHLVLSTTIHSTCVRFSPLEQFIGSSKIHPNNRITIIKEGQKKLKVKVGDVIVYLEDEKGNLMIKKHQCVLSYQLEFNL